MVVVTLEINFAMVFASLLSFRNGTSSFLKNNKKKNIKKNNPFGYVVVGVFRTMKNENYMERVTPLSLVSPRAFILW